MLQLLYIGLGNAGAWAPFKTVLWPEVSSSSFYWSWEEGFAVQSSREGLCSQGQLSCMSSDKALYLSCLFAWWGWFLCSCAHPFEVLRRRSVFQRVECSTKREQMPGELWRCPWLTAGKVGWGVGVFGWLALFGCPLGILGGWLVWLLAFVLFFLLAVTMCEVQAQPVLLSDGIPGGLTSAQVDQREHLALPEEKAGCHVQGKRAALIRACHKVNGTVAVCLWQLLMDKSMHHNKAIVHCHSPEEGCVANSRLLPSAELTNGLAAASNQLSLHSKCSAQKNKASRFLFGCYLSGRYLYFLLRN